MGVLRQLKRFADETAARSQQQADAEDHNVVKRQIGGWRFRVSLLRSRETALKGVAPPDHNDADGDTDAEQPEEDQPCDPSSRFLFAEKQTENPEEFREEHHRETAAGDAFGGGDPLSSAAAEAGDAPQNQRNDPECDRHSEVAVHRCFSFHPQRVTQETSCPIQHFQKWQTQLQQITKIVSL